MSEIPFKKLAFFADNSSEACYSNIAFHQGEAWSQGIHGGMLCKTPGFSISVTVPAAKMLKAVQAVGENLEIKQKDTKITLSGEGGKASLVGGRVEDMPEFPRLKPNVEWHVADFSRLKDFEWGVCKDITRRSVSGFHLSPEGNVTATDGSVLVRYKLANPLPGIDVLVPPQPFRNMPNPVYVAKQGNRLFISEDKGESGYQFVPIIDAEFPSSIQNVIDSALNQFSFCVERNVILDVLKRAKLSSRDIQFSYSIQKGLCVEAVGDSSEFAFSANVEFIALDEKPFPEGVINFDLTKLFPAFTSIVDKHIEIFLTPEKEGGRNPIVIADDTGGDDQYKYFALVMPYSFI